jgi:hypothetical protein
MRGCVSMNRIVESILLRMAQCSSIFLQDYISKFYPNEVSSLRFFSYGSNMNEEKFRKDTKKHGFEFGLENVQKTTLQGYKRILGNKSKNHGLAFTICPFRKEQTEGICHDIPIQGLESFLKKEGLLSDEPSYELIMVSVHNEDKPVLTLKGLKPFSIDKLNRKDKLNAYCYVCETIEGAKKWQVDYSDMSTIKNRLKKELSTDV